MKKIALIFQLIIVSLLLSGCILPWETPSYSAIQIISAPYATVYIDAKERGKTPFYDDKILPGEHDIRLVSDSASFSSWQGKVKFTPQILTVINRILGPSDILSSGETIIMEPINEQKTAELAIVSSPDGAKVVIDNQDAGITPFAQKNTSIGDHEITISLSGYSKRLVKVKTRGGYRLVINAQLAQVLTSDIADADSISTATNSGDTIDNNDNSTINNQPSRPRVKILDTPTGWLRVRSAPNVSGTELGKTYPNEYYAYLDEQSGWVKIQFKKDQEGWVSVQYVEKEL